MTNNIALLLFILIFEGDKSEASPLTMGFGKTLDLHYNTDQFSARAFDFNIFPESGERFEDLYQSSHHSGHLDQRRHQVSSPPSQHYLEIDLKFAKKKNIPGVRHLFCSGHYCAFEYADHVLHHEKQELFG